MIFGSLVHRAESAVNNILEQALARLFIAIPLLIALGFGTAAASTYLNARYGAETGHLIMAGVFAGIGLLVAIIVSMRSSPSMSETTAPAAESAASSESNEASSTASALPLTASEKELLSSVAAAAAPIAVPGVVRLLLRNIPLVLVFLLIAFLMSRQGTSEERPEAVPA